jgi:peptidoglycan hydrolase-like protein with peptidoglycan-binding domain
MFNSIKISLVAIALSLFIIPSSSLAQVTDVDTSGGGTSSCIVINNNLSYKNRASNNKGDVLALQDFLSNRGYLNDSSVTGFFGKATENAVIAFQKDNRLVANPPGFVGVGTRAVIQRMSCGGTTAISISPTTGLPSGCSSASGFSSSTGMSCLIGVTTNTVCNSEQYLENGVCKDITQRCPDGSVIPAMLRCGTAVATTSPVSLKIVSGSTSTGKIDVELNLTKNHDGKFVVFMVNPINVATPVSSGDLMTSVYYYNNAFPGPFRVTLDTTKAHQGFATNQGGVHWFNLPSGKYELSAVVYSSNPFKSGTDMEYVDMNVLQAIPYEVVRGEEFDFAGTPSVPVTSISPILNFRTPPTLSLKYDSVGKESLLVGTAVIKVTAGSQPLTSADIAVYPIVINRGGDGYSYNNAYPVQTNSTKYTITDDSGKVITYGQEILIKTNESKIFTYTISIPTKELFADRYVLTTRDWYYGNQMLSASAFINARASNPVTVIGEKSPYISNVTSDANGIVTVTGQRLDLSGNYLQIDGMGSSMVSKFGPTATSFKFDSKAYGLEKGFHTITITNTQTGNSTITGFTIENTPTSASSVLATVTEGPTLTLGYDSYQKEASLVSSMKVKVTAGTADLIIKKVGSLNQMSSYAYFAMTAVSSAGHAAGSEIASISVDYGTVDNGDYWTVKAGQTAKFKVSSSFKLKQMFAGVYHAEPAFYNVVNNQGTGNILATPAGNFVTIIGETSPYILKAESDVNGTVTVTGQRLNLSGNYLQIDGMGNSMVSKFGPSATSFKFDSKNYNLEKGSHVLRITNAQTGDSNDARLDITTSPVNPYPICTQDMYQCSDGTWVARSGSNCQFVCPTSPSTPTPSLIANPSSGALSSTYQGQTTSPTMWVDFTVKNYTLRGGEIIKFGDGTESALGYSSSTNARHDYHTAGTYTVKLVLPMHEEYVNQTFTLMAEQLIASTAVTVLPEVVIKGTYMGYLGGGQTPFITTQNITKADALANCMTNHTNNPTKSIRCTWNGIEIYTFTPVTPLATTVTVVSPNGGEVYKIGDIINIKWSSNNSTAKVKVLLLQDLDQNGSFEISTQITSSYISSNAISWNIPSTVKPGSRSRITIISDKYNANYRLANDESDATFSIVEQGVSCPAPGVMVNGVCTNDGDANPGDVGGGSGGNEGGVLGVYTSAMCTNLPINLHRGMEKPSVSLLQSFLVSKGILGGEVTGFYGDKTVEAVKDYQASKGLPLTGMVYDFTREAIRAESCQ